MQQDFILDFVHSVPRTLYTAYLDDLGVPMYSESGNILVFDHHFSVGSRYCFIHILEH